MWDGAEVERYGAFSPGQEFLTFFVLWISWQAIEAWTLIVLYASNKICRTIEDK